MATILDYINWRGDLTLSQDPFNEVDNVLLAMLSYVDFGGIVPGVEEEGAICLREAAEIYEKRCGEDLSPERLPERLSTIRTAPIVMNQMSRTKRFEDMLLRKYVDQVSKKKSLQFSAMEILTGDGTSYISYRGTDDTLVGWKEDFYLSFEVVPAEKNAIEYLDRIQAGRETPLRVGGHSKGGHLAVYASAFCKEQVRERIQKIYNNDGPGFHESLVESPELMRIRERICKLIPDTSIAGMLMWDTVKPQVLHSGAKLTLQHNPINWQVDVTSFERCEELSKQGKMINRAMDQWLRETEPQQRREFTDALFDALDAAGFRELSALSEGGFRTIMAMRPQMKKMDERNTKILEELFKLLFAQVKDELAESGTDFLKKKP